MMRHSPKMALWLLQTASGPGADVNASKRAPKPRPASQYLGLNQKGAAFAAPYEVTDYPDYESKRRADCGSEFA